jgi:hypothetical protein
MEALNTIQKRLNDKLNKNKQTFEAPRGWGEYIPVSLAQEFIRQAIDDACFFFTLKRAGCYDPMEELREKIKSLQPGETIFVRYYEFESKSSFISWAHNIVKAKEVRTDITVKDCMEGWKVKRKS